MKRRLAIVAALLPLLLLTLPALVGLQVESRYHRLAGQRAMTHLDFERGWFGSIARWRLRVPDLPPLEVVDEIRHGPFLASGLGLAGVRSRVAGAGFDDGGLRIDTRVALDGGGHARLVWPGSLRVNGLELGAGRALLDFDASFSRLGLEARAVEVRIPSRGAPLALDRATLRLELQRRVSVWDGRLQLRAERARLGRRDYAPLMLRGGFSRVDPYLLASLRPLLDSTGGWMQRLARLRLLTQVLPPLLSSDPELHIERLHLGSGDDALEASGSLGIDPAWQRDASLLKIPAYLRARLDVDMAEADARALIRVWSGDGQALDTLLRGGWLLEKDARVRVRARAQDGILELNGESLPLNSILFRS